MRLSDHRPPAGVRLVWCIVCFLGALGQANAASAAAGPPPEGADAGLKTCLQRHYEAANDDMSVYRLGDALIAACRTEWDAARSACAATPGKTHESCDARMKMMVLGFVPMH